MINVTDQFLDSMWEFSHKDFPEEIMEQAKACLLDYLGCTFFGSRELLDGNDFTDRVYNHETGKCSAVGAKKGVTLQHAALMNGIASHMAELDDGHRVAMMHPGATIISALLPTAQAYDLFDGELFLKAIVVGYEACIRLAASIQPSHKLRGFHGTGTCGEMGAAIAAAFLLGLTREEWKAVISAAATSAAGLLAIQDDGSTMKAFNIGQASSAGVQAAIVGSLGLVGPEDILSGKRGFLIGHSDQVKETVLFEGFGGYAIEKIYRKTYAACRHCHSAIEGALEIRKQIAAENVRRVSVETYDLAVKGHDHTEILGCGSAKMSLPYSVAAAFVLGNAGVDAFDKENVNDETILKLTKKVDVSVSEELSALVPAKRAAIVRVETTDDRILSQRVDYPKGEPENPVTKEELEEKYRTLMKMAGVSGETTDRLMNAVYDLENRFEELLRLL